MGVGASEHDPPISPTRSPNVTRAGLGAGREDISFDEEPARPTTSPLTTSGESAEFFEHELRGYPLLKSAKLSQAERQHMLTLTRNSTHFHQIRQALRSLFSDGAEQGDDLGRHPRRHVWYADEGGEWLEPDDWWQQAEDPTAWWAEEAYWQDWSPSQGWDDDSYYEADFDLGESLYPGEGDGQDQTAEEAEGEKRLEEAYTIAAEQDFG